MYNTLTNKVRLQFGPLGTDESSAQSLQNESTSGGDIYRFVNADGEGNGGDRSPGDPNGGDSNIGQNKCGSKDDGDDRKRREFLLAKASNINVTVFTGSP